MKNLVLIFVVSISLLTSCKKSITNTDLEGSWVCDNCIDDYFFSFKNDTIYWSGTYDFIKKGAYQINNNQLLIFSKDDSFKFTINHFQENIDEFGTDSLVLDTMSFRGNFDYTLNHDVFELIDLEDEPFVFDEEKKKMYEYFPLMCFMKNDSFMIKGNRTYLRVQDIPDYLYYAVERSPRNPRPFQLIAIFLEKGIKLKDFSELQYWLSYYEYHRIFFFSQSRSFYEFSAFEMKLPIFDVLNTNNKWKPTTDLPPLSSGISIDIEGYINYFKNAKKILINTSMDLSKLDNIEKEDKVHILFNENLDM